MITKDKNKRCMICDKEISSDIWPKYIYSPEGEEPLCVDCWGIEYEKYRQECQDINNDN